MREGMPGAADGRTELSMTGRGQQRSVLEVFLGFLTLG
jgi:hypothetical protein